MQAQRLNITLPYELARDFKRAIPVSKRSQFIAVTVKEKLAEKSRNRNLKKELTKSLKANYKFYEKFGKEIEEDFKYADAEVISRIP